MSALVITDDVLSLMVMLYLPIMVVMIFSIEVNKGIQHNQSHVQGSGVSFSGIVGRLSLRHTDIICLFFFDQMQTSDYRCISAYLWLTSD